MGIFREAASAGLAAAGDIAAADAVAGSGRKKRSGDSPGDKGLGPPDPGDSDGSSNGSDGSYGSRFLKRFGANLGRSSKGSGR